MSRSYLALDVGAESGRAMLAHLDGHRLTLTELHRFLNTPVTLPTGLYWDTFRLFHEICHGIREAANAAEDLDGIGVDTWGVDFGLLGSDGSLVENPRHYRDHRTHGVMQQVCDTVTRQAIFAQTGTQFMDINSLYQLVAIRRDAPDALAIAAKLLFMPDLFNYFLTAAVRSERTVASTSQFYDPVKKCFATDLLRKLGIDAGFLAELIDPGTELGPVLPKIAESCGLKREPCVYAVGSHDTASAVAAVPARSDESWCYISSGTWSLIGVELDEPLIADAALDANFTNEAGVEGKVRFLRNIPGLWVLQECRRTWARQGLELSYADLMERAASARPLGITLDLEQFSSPGDYPRMICDVCRLNGRDMQQDPGSIARIVLDSIAARYGQVLETLQKVLGRGIQVIHIVGGGSRNRLLNQLTADATRRRVVAGPAEATAVGNALMQAMGSGQVQTLEELRAIVRHSFEVEEFLPHEPLDREEPVSRGYDSVTAQ
ncbi:MAG: rhamnulokinase [Acidobacteriaceae bacterium]|nr:rhamnulokinase [Acidobacteriaceae bacterium]MBV8570714.1 rhamnulokinase [Acidobacteriaceae bacterium]